jgi:hypothetical protein
MWIGWENKDFIIRNLGKSPSLATYFNYVYPYTFFLMIFYWLEAFAWGLQKGVFTNFLRETAVRILTTCRRIKVAQSRSVHITFQWHLCHPYLIIDL